VTHTRYGSLWHVLSQRLLFPRGRGEHCHR